MSFLIPLPYLPYKPCHSDSALLARGIFINSLNETYVYNFLTEKQYKVAFNIFFIGKTIKKYSACITISKFSGKYKNPAKSKKNFFSVNLLFLKSLYRKALICNKYFLHFPHGFILHFNYVKAARKMVYFNFFSIIYQDFF